MPRSCHFVFDEELSKYFMPLNLLQLWLQVDLDISDAVYLICHIYEIPFLYPINTFCFGYSKGHTWSGGLHMALHKGRDWFVVWMALLSYVIAGAQDIHSLVIDSVTRTKPTWYNIYLSTLILSGLMPFMPQLSAHFLLKRHMLEYF